MDNNFNIEFQQMQAANLPSAQAKKPFNFKLIIIIVAIISVIGICIAIFAGGKIGGKKEEEKKSDKELAQDAVETYFDAYFKGKTSNFKALLPEETWQYYLDEYEDFADAYDSTKELIDAAEEGYAIFYENELINEYGEFDKYDYEIDESEEVSESKLEKIAEALSVDYGIDEDSVKKAYKLTLDGEIIFEDDEIDVDDVYSVKIGNNWYIVSGEDDYYYFLGSRLVGFALYEY